MPRLFVAIDLPDEVKDQLRGLKANIPGARWVGPHQLHLTLRFLGNDVPDADVPALIDALRSVRAAPFSLTLQGVGRFPPGQGAARVLWVGVRPDTRLNRLYGGIEQALAGVGYPPEERSFAPHITLARLKAPAPAQAVEAFLTRHARFAVRDVPAREFSLFSSLLTPEGPRYRVEASIALNV